ncbi:MAG: DnaQ exonuclease/DinG helicase family protein [Chloroflexi bacterium OLB15]|nr:MAG: DnaQ exonuclease/DinG helicase family protein [Chloroflexi bacterium OLB15]
MRGEIVAVDLETTGFDPVRDEIIEIGAVRWVNGVLTEEFTTFVDPRREIPPVITQLTGIRDEDVIGAPTVSEAVAQISSFVGKVPWIAHNISFDASFLNKRGALLSNPHIDTFELASVLLPGAPRYNLGSLADQMGFDIGSAHRALDDARATGHIFLAMWQKLMELSPDVILEILDASRGLNWEGRFTFETAASERGFLAAHNFRRNPLFTERAADNHELEQNEKLAELDTAEVQHYFKNDGKLAQALSRFESRPQQEEMATAVTSAFNASDIVMIEAGTGTGKSLAYLIPALEWSHKNNERVVISTHTINLQEQLLKKDIPDLAGALDFPFEAALLKGRGNYLCPRRFEFARNRAPANLDELRVLAKILVWTQYSKSGDKGEISLRGGEGTYWSRLSAEDEGCGEYQCRFRMNGVCPFHKARQAAKSANLIIVNHALLVADALSDNQVLPPYSRLIIDEAHQLEDAVTGGLSYQIDEIILRRHIQDIGSVEPARGLLGMIDALVQHTGAEKERQKLHAFAANVGEAVTVMNVHISRFFNDLHGLLNEHVRGGNDYTPSLRITPAIRDHGTFATIAETYGHLEEFLEAIAAALLEIHSALTRRDLGTGDEFEDLLSALTTEAHFLAELQAWLNAFFAKSNDNLVYWLNAFQTQFGQQVSLNSAPVYVGNLIRESLFERKDTVVLTSATLQTNNTFSYLQHRLGAEEIQTVDVGSPFDYKSSTLLYLSQDIPDPSDKSRYQAAVERGIIELAAALEGRTVALFTSYSQLRTTSSAITPRLRLGGITVYDQSDGSSRQALLDGFKRSEKAVLLATRSFWEGVDIPGEDLSALVIVRLPFAVPTDPVIAARTETYQRAFDEYSVPDAILRFRQGFGRLIRTKTDRGIVTVFDNRILTKSYGARFIEALPDCTLMRGTLDQLPNAAKKWLLQTS